jgi:hypothetical protein
MINIEYTDDDLKPGLIIIDAYYISRLLTRVNFTVTLH